MGNRVLILTDRHYHRERDSIFPIAAHLSQNPLIDKVWVADRSDPRNDGFYGDHDLQFDCWSVRPVDENFTINNAMDDATRPATTIGVDDFDALWIRLEHPVSLEFLRYLEARLPGKFTVNDAAGLATTMTKAYMIELAKVMGDLMPRIALCGTAAEVQGITDLCEQGVVLKQVMSNGGKGVARYRPGRDTDLHDIAEVEIYLRDNGPCLAMEYLNPPGPQSDNRVLVASGVILGVVSRIPKEGSWICNLSSGGSAENIEATAQEVEIIRRLDPLMRQNGIFLYGADMLVNDQGLRVLSEVNTLNVGAVAVGERLTGRPLTRFVADNLAYVISTRDFYAPIQGRQSIAA